MDKETSKAVFAVGSAVLVFTKKWLGSAVVRLDQPNNVFLVTGVNALNQRILIDTYWVPITAVKQLSLGCNSLDVEQQIEILKRTLD